MNTLPQAIQLVLPMLAADGGRARVQTLLAIQGAGPDYVRQHLTGIDAALGTASPGTTALGDLIRKAEDSVSTPSTVERQHFISQGVLRRFVENLPSGQKLAKFNIATGRVEHLGTRRVGYVSHFVPVDSEATEKLWQEVENHLTQATTAALNGTALTNPAHLSTLRHAVALHFARNPQTLTIHNQSFADALKGQVDQLAKTPLAAEAFKRQHHGLEPAGTEALRMGAEGVQDRLVRLHQDGGLFRLSVQRLFEMVRDRFDPMGIQILTPASPSKEFLLGDIPALTVNHATGAVGLAQGVTADQADEILMPLAPRLLVAVGPPGGTRALPDDEVDQYNQRQARAAQDYLIHRPEPTSPPASRPGASERRCGGRRRSRCTRPRRPAIPAQHPQDIKRPLSAGPLIPGSHRDHSGGHTHAGQGRPRDQVHARTDVQIRRGGRNMT